MKRKFRMSTVVTIMTILTFCNYSCSSDNNFYSDTKIKTQEKTTNSQIDKILNTLTTYDNFINNTITTKSSHFNIIDYKKETLSLKSSITQTKGSSNTIPPDTSIDIYTVIFEKNAQEGYSILTLDTRLSKVYAYTEYGNLTDTIENKVLAEIFKVIPEICKMDLETFYTKPQTKGIPADYFPFRSGPTILSKMDTKWPYNKFFPFVSGTTDRPEFNNHYTSNTTAVALAQFLCRFTPQGNISVSTSPTEDDLARMFKFVAYESDPQGRVWAEYMDGLIYKPLQAIQYLEKAGFKFEFQRDNKKADPEKIYDSLIRNGMPVIMYYNLVPLCWTISGISGEHYAEAKKLGIIQTLHCNWGLNGKSDGWYTNWYRPAHSSVDKKSNEIIYFKKAN